MHDKPKISESFEDYLEAVLVLEKQLGNVRSIDVAHFLDFTKPSVSHAVALLCENGFLTRDGQNFLHLTDSGREIAEKFTRGTAFSEIF